MSDPMKALLLQIAGTWIRWALNAATVFLVTKHALTAPQGEQLSTMLIDQTINALPGAVAQLWSMLQKYWAAQREKTALALPAGKTTADLTATIAAGGAAKLT